MVLNKYMVKNLELFNMWNEEPKDNIILNNGSIQSVKDLYLILLKIKYKTVWKIKQKNILI